MIVAQLVAGNTQEFLTETMALGAELAKRPQIRALDPNKCDPVIADFPARHPVYASLGTATLDGQSVCSALPKPPSGRHASVAGLDWFKTFSANGRPMIGKAYLGIISKTWVSVAATPIRDDAGALKGVLALPIRLKRFQPLKHGATLPPGATITILDDEGTVLARSHDAEAWVGRNLRGSQIADTALAQDQGSGRGIGVLGDRVFGFALVPLTRWHVVASVPIETVLEGTWRAVIGQAIAGGLITLLVGLLAFLFASHIDAAMQAIRRATQAAAEGDMRPVDIAGPSEIADLAGAINRLIETRQATESALKEREERLAQAFDTAPNGMALMSLDGLFLKVNKALCAITGRSEVELLGLDIGLITHAQDRRLNPTWIEDLRSGAVAIQNLEQQLILPTGGTIWVRISLSLARDSLGQPLHFVAQIQDISREKAAAAAQAQAMTMLIKSSPLPIAILRQDETGALFATLASDQFAKATGIAIGQSGGVPLSQFVPQITGRDIGGGLTLHHTLPAGEQRAGREIELTFQPALGGYGRFGSIIVTARDLSAESQAARAEAESARLEALGRMAGRIAHEVNNLLQPIMSHASLARAAAAGNDRALEHIAEIQEGVRHGRDIVRTVLALAGTGMIARSPCRLEAEVAKALTLIEATIPARIVLDRDIAPTTTPIALAPAELVQILQNLIVNAVDAIDGDGRIGVSTRDCTLLPEDAGAVGLPPGAYAELTVRDSGGGMDKDTLARALDPFFTTKPLDKGTGLGLSTVRNITESVGGAIVLSSTPGRGTEARVLFPATSPHDRVS